jgi:hypothetical protein
VNRMAIALMFLAIGQLVYSQEANKGRAAGSRGRDKIIAELRAWASLIPASTRSAAIPAAMPPISST